MKELKQLQEGNARYARGQPLAKPLSPKERAALAKGQKPFAVILACADSRVIPNYIFDQPEGKLFVCRVAGNVITQEILGSIEYAVEHLGSSFVLVLGHTNCGAVKAACEAHGEGGGNIGSILAKIHPAVNEVRGRLDPAAKEKLAEEYLTEVVKENVKRALGDLKAGSTALRRLSAEGKLTLQGAVYSLQTGEVELI